MTEVTSEPGRVNAGDWTVVFATETEDFALLYRGSRVDPPAGYDMLICDLAKCVTDQHIALDELAEDPDVAVPASTRDNEAAIQQVARIAVEAVFEQTNVPIVSDSVLRPALISHFASLLGHYSRRTENLMRERDGLHLVLQDSRAAEWNAAQNSGYWHKRCAYVEECLLPFANAYEAVMEIQGAAESMGTISVQLDDTRLAYQILAEMRKHGGPAGDYERYTRDRRQAKIMDWAQRTFNTETFDATDLEERAFRFLEEAIELWQSAMHHHLTEANDGQAFSITEAAVAAGEKPWMRPALEKLARLFARVMAGDPGEIGREYGGLMVTAACLAERTGHSLAQEEQREFARVTLISRDEFQARHQVKRDAGI